MILRQSQLRWVCAARIDRGHQDSHQFLTVSACRCPGICEVGAASHIQIGRDGVLMNHRLAGWINNPDLQREVVQSAIALVDRLGCQLNGLTDTYRLR
ncbi:hypothetical protein SDC9_184552 [bioreactor metagenome]|uniref:Uncharacterized protein n=1 Tax=bioreactor metagenome TaxID=1076179 RepID=A0A645HEQ9_9ZZZZ